MQRVLKPFIEDSDRLLQVIDCGGTLFLVIHSCLKLMATEQNRTQEGGVSQSQRDPELFSWIKSPICLDWVQVICHSRNVYYNDISKIPVQGCHMIFITNDLVIGEQWTYRGKEGRAYTAAFLSENYQMDPYSSVQVME